MDLKKQSIGIKKNIKNKLIKKKNKSKLIFNKRYPDGTMRKIMDNKIIKKLGWKPKIPLEIGLSKTIIWYKKNHL